MIVAAIPVHNEEAHIGTLLTALAQQSGVPPFEVVLLLNNCCDRTAAVVTALAPSLPYRIHLHEHMLQGADANAGTARRMAMERARGPMPSPAVR
jgi:glycosyltransferase involved in cell wall biosynthesis